MYQTILVDDIKVATKVQQVENGKPSRSLENGKVQASLERMSITRKSDDARKQNAPPRNLRVQIRKLDPVRNGPASPQKNLPRSPQKSSPPHRSAPQSPQKKTSPQELRSKKSPPTAKGSNVAAQRTESAQQQESSNSPPLTPDLSPQNGNNDENILRQQNSRSSTPSSTAPSTKYKANNKVYFREENVENLTWNGETSFDGDVEDPDASTSPKVNPYSSSFLNFLSSN